MKILNVLRNSYFEKGNSDVSYVEQLRQRFLNKSGFFLRLTGRTYSRTYAGAQPEIFQGRGGFVESGHFDKHFDKNTRKERPAGKSFGIFFT